MRQTRTPQLALGEARIEDIKLDHKSRDDIPAALLGLQHLYSHEETREKLFSLLEEHILPGTNRNSRRNRDPTIHRSKAVGEPPLMHALSVFSAVTHALASLAPGRVPPLDAPATPEAILRAADEMQGDGS